MEIPGLFANAKETVELSPGQVLFHEADPGTEMFGVISGEIELRKGDRVLASIGPDGVFGEMALIDNSARSLDAVATQPTVPAAIDRRRFLFLITETPTFALQVMSTMAERLRTLTGRHPLTGQAADSAVACVLISVRSASTARVCS